MTNLTPASQHQDIQELEQRIITLIEQSRHQIVNHINHIMVYTYFQIGREIVEVEQKGEQRAKYGQKLLVGLSQRLTEKYGRGFSRRNLSQMRNFYLTYREKFDDLNQSSIWQTPSAKSGNHNDYLLISETVSRQSDSHERQSSIIQTLSAKFTLSWSHYLFLMGIDNKQQRQFYENEAVTGGWSLSELKRQFDSGLYERLALSRDKQGVRELAAQGQIIAKPEDLIKEPYVLDFLGLPEDHRYSESTLEQRIIDELQNFLLEMGKGFTFVGRQIRFTFEEKHFRVDLVFFNRLLQCFVLVDLKVGDVTHQDLGQMQMYVNYYDRFVKQDFENPTIGILLCQKKNDMIVKLTLPENNSQIFASKYETVLPKKEELRRLLKEKDLLVE